MSLMWLALPGVVFWAGLLLLPWQPWRTRESLDAAGGADSDEDLSDITALIPARDEAERLPDTVAALARQGRGLRVVLIDDDSADATAAVAEETAAKIGLANLRVLRGRPLPPGWSGKPWALQQGLESLAADTDMASASERLLLLDADIQLLPGAVAAMRRKMDAEQRQLVSLMAVLRMQTGWEKLLLPAFVYFFKLLYPFRLANAPQPLIAAAAGGCMLLQRRVVEEIGGFAAIKNALIDDCTLARKIKNAGYRTWVGLSRSAVSLRPYPDLASIWSMVARSAFTQLRCSLWLLALCSALLAVAFLLPMLSLLVPLFMPPRFAAEQAAVGMALGAAAWALMSASYLPVIRYYRLRPAWALSLPAAGVLYLCMTWRSAWRYYRGGPRWKGRVYSSEPGAASRPRP